MPLAVAALVQGYVSRLLVELVFFAAGALVAISTVPAASSMLLPEGRRRKYDLALAAAVSTTLLLTTLWAVAFVSSKILAALLPTISWGTHHWQYAGLPTETLLLVCLPVPWVFLSGPVWHQVPILRAALTVVVAFLVMGELSARDYAIYHGPTLLPVLLASGWALFPLALWLTYRRWDLVGQRPAMND